MRRSSLIPILFVSLLGLSLHFLFSNLSGTLAQLFPHLSRAERPPTPSEPITLKPEPGRPEPGKLAPPAVMAEALQPRLTPEEFFQPDHRPIVPKTGRRHLEGWVRVSPIPMPVSSVPVGQGQFAQVDFSVPPELVPPVEFWQKIYGVYDTKQVLFHDEENLGVQYSVLDLRQGLDQLSTDAEKKKYREEMVAQEMDRIKALLTDPEARKRVRSQVGLKDRFREGVIHSGRYLAHFEKIFASYGVPKEITRLPFVESLFKERALSKVAAAGLWQFMPGTARQYMVVDSLVDERYDPIRAAHGAARLLLKNYQLLKSWPLAINAYNSGPGNLLRAVSQLGTRNITTIILRHSGGGYGFASRNFYPEFLAALGVYENREKFFGPLKQEPAWEFETIQLPGTMTMPEIAFLANVPLSELNDLNPGFADEVFSEKHSLPIGSEIRLAPNRQKLFASRFLEYYSAGQPPRLHIVSAGDTVSKVAHAYGVSPSDLMGLNHRQPLREGEALLIPSEKTVARD